MRILIAEAENDLVLLFTEYLTSLGVKTEIASNGSKAIDYFRDREMKGRPYDAIILDTHLLNPSGIDVAKRIHLYKPGQKIVLVTTTQKEQLPVDCLENAGINYKDILTIPFKLSKIVSVLKN